MRRNEAMLWISESKMIKAQFKNIGPIQGMRNLNSATLTIIAGPEQHRKNLLGLYLVRFLEYVARND